MNVENNKYCANKKRSSIGKFDPFLFPTFLSFFFFMNINPDDKC